jgi:paraquat-inducible protein B
VGSVTDISVVADRRDFTIRIPVYIEILPKRIRLINGRTENGNQAERAIQEATIERLVEQGLRAQLGMQSLVTGQLYVDLDFRPDKPIKLVGMDTRYQELPTVPSSFEEISKTIETLPLDQLANKVTSAIEGIEGFVNSPELKEIVSSLNQTVKELRELIGTADARLAALASGLDKTLEETRKLVRDVDGQVKPLAAGVQETVNKTKTLVETVEKRASPLLNSVEDTFKTTRSAAMQAEKALSAVEGIAGEGSGVRVELSNALQEIAAAARSLRVLADYLERHPEALLHGKSEQGGR